MWYALSFHTKSNIKQAEQLDFNRIWEPIILKTTVDFNAEARCARDEVVGLPERREPEGLQGAARRKVTQRKSEVMGKMENTRIFLTE